MALTADEIKIAQNTIDKWFWQPVDSKFFRYKYAVKNLVRYYECAPVAADTLRIIIEYLRTEEVPDGGKISLLNKQVGGFDGWKAQDAWYQTAASDQWEGTKSDKIRIFQTLIGHDDESEGDGPYAVENGCRYKVTHTFYWNTEALPELPDSSSGVNYTMQGVTRDRETGLFSCVIECRERQQQDIGLYDSAKTQFETRQIEQHLGVKADNVESTGEAASVENGVITERRLTKNEDCTTDIENVVTTEESVSEAVVEFRKTLRGTVTTILDRNQAEALDESGMEVGETRRSEKTPGKRFNNTTVKSAKEAAGIIARSCTKTQFEHEHQTVENVASEPSESSDLSASSASGGRIHTRTIRKTEENTFDITDTVRTEESVSEAVVEYRKTLRGTVTTILDRNQPDPLDESGMVIGETRRSEKTPGKRFNNTTVKSAKEAAGIIARSCTKTQFEHEHQTVENVASEPSESSDLSASSASGGRIHTRTIRKTEENTFDITDTVRTEESVSEAVVEYRKTQRSVYKTVVDRNQPGPLDESGMEVGETRRSEKTPGRLYNNTVTSRIRTIAGTIATMCLKAGGGSMHQHQTVEMVDIEPESSAGSAACNYQRQRVVQKTEDGYQVENTVTQWAPRSKSKTWSDENFNYVHMVYVNQTEPMIPESGDVISCTYTINNHGSYDGTYTVRNGKTAGEGQTLQWSVGPSDCEANYYYFNKKGKLCHRKVTGSVYRCYGKASHVAAAINGSASGTGGTGSNMSGVGWYTGMWMSGNVHAFGTKYTNVVVGPEVIDDDGSQAT